MFASLRALATVLIGLIAGAPAPAPTAPAAPAVRLHATTMPVAPDIRDLPITLRQVAHRPATVPAIPVRGQYRCIVVVSPPAIIR
jgi:hypothetical protein